VTSDGPRQAGGVARRDCRIFEYFWKNERPVWFGSSKEIRGVDTFKAIAHFEMYGGGAGAANF